MLIIERMMTWRRSNAYLDFSGQGLALANDIDIATAPLHVVTVSKAQHTTKPTLDVSFLKHLSLGSSTNILPEIHVSTR